MRQRDKDKASTTQVNTSSVRCCRDGVPMPHLALQSLDPHPARLILFAINRRFGSKALPIATITNQTTFDSTVIHIERRVVIGSVLVAILIRYCRGLRDQRRANYSLSCRAVTTQHHGCNQVICVPSGLDTTTSFSLFTAGYLPPSRPYALFFAT